MHVEDFIGKIASGLNGVHHLPDQMRRIVLQTHIRSVSESCEQGIEAGRAYREIGAARVRLPEYPHVVLFTGGKILFGIDANDIVHLLLEGPARIGVLSRRSAD